MKARRDEPSVLLAAGGALEEAGDLVGAASLLRRALALGAIEERTVNLARKVEFLMEDLPQKLP